MERHHGFCLRIHREIELEFVVNTQFLLHGFQFTGTDRGIDKCQFECWLIYRFSVKMRSIEPFKYRPFGVRGGFPIAMRDELFLPKVSRTILTEGIPNYSHRR